MDDRTGVNVSGNGNGSNGNGKSRLGDVVELRIRKDGGDAFRYELGRARTRSQRATLEAQRDTLRRLHDRGELDVLEAVKRGSVTAATVERLVDQFGIGDYRPHLERLLLTKLDVPTLDDHMARWLRSLANEKTRGVYRYKLGCLANAVVDGVRLGGLPWHTAAPSHVIAEVKAEMRKTMLPNTIRGTVAAWAGFFAWAIDDETSRARSEGRARLRTDNPVQKRLFDKVEISRHRFLSPAEARKLIDVAPPELRAQYATLIFCGLRIDELLSLPPAHVRLPSHIHIGPFGGWKPKGFPKNTNGVRDVPIHRELLPLLEEYATKWAGTETFFVSPYTLRPWQYTTFRKNLARDVNAAGMRFGQWKCEDGKPSTRDPQGVTAHTMRHTLASWLAQADVQVLKIARILGDSTDTVVRHYAHLLPQDLDLAINRVGWGAVPVGGSPA